MPMHDRLLPLRQLAAAFVLLSFAAPQAASGQKVAAPTQAACQEATGEALLARVRKRYRRQSVTARFEQTYVDAVLGPRASERGRLWLDGRGRMRFAYEVPEAKIFVFDGNTASFEETSARQVTVLAHFDRSPGAAALSLLAGPTANDGSFRLEAGQAAHATNQAGRLTFLPSRADAGFARAELQVGRTNCLIEGITVTDAVGNQSRYALSDIALGGAAPADAFVRQLPAGFDVLHVDAAATTGAATGAAAPARTPPSRTAK